MRCARVARRLAGTLLPIAAAGCKLPGVAGDAAPTAYAPTWITAAWGSTAGSPSLRFDRDAVLHFDATCPAYSFSFRISVGYDSLSVSNHCDRSTTIYACATVGGTGVGIHACASDPLETAVSSMIATTLPAGSIADIGLPVQNIQLELFYCGDNSRMLFLPLRCSP